MNKDSLTDYIACILFRVLGPLIRILPLGVSFFLGRSLGILFFTFDLKHKAIAYASIKTALGANLSPSAIKQVVRRFYQAYGQNLIEIFLIPRMDKAYLDRNIQVEGLDNAKAAFKRGKGVIFLSVHAGSWELSNILSAHLGMPFVLLVRDQKLPRLNKLLNSYRIKKSYKIIEKDSGVRGLIAALKNNEAVAMMADQGGRDGTIVKFFGKESSMPTGALRFALKYDAAILPVYYTRIKGPKVKVIFDEVFALKKTADLERDIKENLQELMKVFEKNIRKYPYEYLWTYKIWKYGRQKNILLLSDGKAGHIRQAQALADTVSGYLKEEGMIPSVYTQEVIFKNNLAKTALALSSGLAGKYHCQGCLWCLKTFLRDDVYKSLVGYKPDIIISCGGGLAPINYVLSRENLSKSIVVMRPSLLSTRRFDLVIMPRHDNPPRRNNVIAINGALNLIDENYLRQQSEKLLSAINYKPLATNIGLLIGGDSKHFRLSTDSVLEVINQVKEAAQILDAGILVTTSRRTSPEVEGLVKDEFRNYPRCKLLVIANEKNIPEAVGGILGLSRLIVVSPESISMICEAAASAKFVLVFKDKVSQKHKRFLERMFKEKYIYLCGPGEISSLAKSLLQDKPAINKLDDRLIIKQALKRII